MLFIIVYSKPDCVQCTATYRMLDARELDYKIIDITLDAEAAAFVAGLGHKRAPVVVVRKDDEVVAHWSGFNPERIAKVSQTPDAVPVAA